MSIIVQKFGGTSVADTEKILAAARKAVRAKQEGHQVVMVVSAMGKNTDMLVSLAQELTDHPPAREMDMLLSTGEQVTVALMAMAIESLGHEAISLTGGQIGIVTDSSHTRARIRSISTERMQACLDEGKIIIAAGFQGIDEDSNITTLGRGGSDTTAVALAAALNADACEIYTDVDGIYTTDPRVVPEARKVSQISYDEMLELASVGAGVMHNRSIEFANKFGVPIHVRSSFSDNPGTMIIDEPESTARPVCGAAMEKNETRVTVVGVPDRPGAAMTIFQKIAAKNIPMDMIVQNVAAAGNTDISFTVFKDDLPATLSAVKDGAAEVGAEGYSFDDNVSKISIVGAGMATQSGVADGMFQALAENGINILLITTSEIKTSVLVQREMAVAALRAVHQHFRLHEVPEGVVELSAKKERHPVAAAEAVDMVARLEGMEDLIIEDIQLDASQARVTLNAVPDRPGLAAEIFDDIAAAGIVVDMIVQSVGNEGLASISFTVPQADLEKSLEVATASAREYGCPAPTSSPAVGKLSVIGIGMRSHTGVATRMFRCLAEAGINVDMISTSEVHVNVVVDGPQGEKARDLLKEEFADVMV